MSERKSIQLATKLGFINSWGSRLEG